MTGQRTHRFFGPDGARARGKAGERIIDSMMRTQYKVDEVGLDTEAARGIDRYWTDRESGLRYGVEYKTDERAIQTGNAFLEILSNEAESVPGWVYTTTAQIIVYFVPGKAIYLLSGTRLKREVAGGLLDGRMLGRAKNDTFYSVGALVPLRELSRIDGLMIDIARVIFKPKLLGERNRDG